MMQPLCQPNALSNGRPGLRNSAVHRVHSDWEGFTRHNRNSNAHQSMSIAMLVTWRHVAPCHWHANQNTGQRRSPDWRIQNDVGNKKLHLFELQSDTLGVFAHFAEPQAGETKRICIHKRFLSRTAQLLIQNPILIRTLGGRLFNELWEENVFLYRICSVCRT